LLWYPCPLILAPPPVSSLTQDPKLSLSKYHRSELSVLSGLTDNKFTTGQKASEFKIITLFSLLFGDISF
jgi:hypothetical protein